MTDLSTAGEEPPFVIGEWTIDTARRSATCRDIVVRLSPRSTNVLLYLAERPGLVVARDELIAKFWAGSGSSANAVHKVVVELRHAFAQDGHETTYIETVPRRGYRLVVPVHGRTPIVPPASEADRAPNVATTRSAIRLLPAVPWLTVLLLAAAGWFVLTHPALLTSTVAAQRANTVAVPAARSLDGGAEGQQIAARLTQALRDAIAEWPGLTLVDPSGVAVATPATLDQVGAKLGAALVLDCTVERADDRTRVRLTLYRTRDRETLYAEQFERPVGAERDLERAVTGNLVAALEVVRDEARVAQMRTAGTRSVGAYLAMQEGQALHRRHGPRSMEFAAQRFRDAIAIDPDFRGAYGELASALGDLAAITFDAPRRRQFSDEIRRLDETLLPARKERPNLQPIWIANNLWSSKSPADIEWKFRSQIIGLDDQRRAANEYPTYAALLASAHLDAQATRLLELFAAHVHDDPWQDFHRLDVATWMKEPHHAIAFERQIVEAYPDAVDVLCDLVVDLAFSGRFDEAQRYLDRLNEADVDGRWAYLAQLIVAALRGDLNDSAARDRALTDARATDYARGVVHFVRGDVEAGVDAWKRVEIEPMLGLVLRTVAFEKLFSDAVRGDPRYEAALDALGVGPGWTAYMTAQWREVEEAVAKFG